MDNFAIDASMFGLIAVVFIVIILLAIFSH